MSRRLSSKQVASLLAAAEKWQTPELRELSNQLRAPKEYNGKMYPRLTREQWQELRSNIEFDRIYNNEDGQVKIECCDYGVEKIRAVAKSLGIEESICGGWRIALVWTVD